MMTFSGHGSSRSTIDSAITAAAPNARIVRCGRSSPPIVKCTALLDSDTLLSDLILILLSGDLSHTSASLNHRAPTSSRTIALEELKVYLFADSQKSRSLLEFNLRARS